MLPLFVSLSHPSSTLPPCDPSATKPLSLVLDLSPLPPLLPTLPPCSGSLESTLQPHLPQMDSTLPIKPLKHLLFHSPLPEGEAMKQAQAWHRDQLLDLRRLCELRQQRWISAGLLPMTQPPTMISDAALGVGNRENTVMVTPLSSQTPLSTSHLDSQCGPPFQPTVWQDLASVVRRPRHWQVDSSMLSTKTTKIPLKFRQHTTTVRSSRTSSPKDLAFPPPLLPKGWVYEVEDVSVKTKAEVVNPNSYLTLDAPLNRLKCKRLLGDQYTGPCHQRCWASNITEALHTSHSASKRTAMKYQCVTSGHTSMRLTPL
jgi:hypothetical protein